MKYTLALAAAAALLSACEAQAPIDNGVATTCAPGTPENQAGSVCQDVELVNGATIVVPPGDDPANYIPENIISNAD